MYVLWSGNRMTLRWTIYKGLTKDAEDFRRARLCCLLLGEEDKWPVTATVVRGRCGNYLQLTVPEGLPPGVYDVTAIWWKNNDRSVARSQRQQVFCVTDDASEATDQGEASEETVLSFHSSAGTYGYDGLGAYELAVAKGLTTMTETEWADAWAKGAITVDDEMSSESENPVQNKVIVNALDGKEDTLEYMTTRDVNALWGDIFG